MPRTCTYPSLHSSVDIIAHPFILCKPRATAREPRGARGDTFQPRACWPSWADVKLWTQFPCGRWACTYLLIVEEEQGAKSGVWKDMSMKQFRDLKSNFHPYLKFIELKICCFQHKLILGICNGYDFSNIQYPTVEQFSREAKAF